MNPIHIKCDVHPWMHAYVCVVDNPFFAVTDGEGNYVITNVPPGNYELAAFHVHTDLANHTYEKQKISVKKGGATEADFVIEAKTR
jgi:hypothetical protein